MVPVLPSGWTTLTLSRGLSVLSDLALRINASIVSFSTSALDLGLGCPFAALACVRSLASCLESGSFDAGSPTRALIPFDVSKSRGPPRSEEHTSELQSQ